MYKLIVVANYLLWQIADCYTTYDQRQDGPFNVEIDVKNVRILALMKGNKEEYVDYDYAYDYSEMTIKPPNGTKPKPTNVTITTTEIGPLNITTNAASTTITEQLTDINKSNSTLTDTEFMLATPYPLTLNLTAESDTTSTSDTGIESTTVGTSANCKKGFVQNSKGHCELQLQGTSNALQKLVKLSQKIKWRRANRHNQEGTE